MAHPVIFWDVSAKAVGRPFSGGASTQHTCSVTQHVRMGVSVIERMPAQIPGSTVRHPNKTLNS